ASRMYGLRRSLSSAVICDLPPTQAVLTTGAKTRTEANTRADVRTEPPSRRIEDSGVEERKGAIRPASLFRSAAIRPAGAFRSAEVLRGFHRKTEVRKDFLFDPPHAAQLAAENAKKFLPIFRSSVIPMQVAPTRTMPGLRARASTRAGSR